MGGTRWNLEVGGRCIVLLRHATRPAGTSAAISVDLLLLALTVIVITLESFDEKIRIVRLMVEYAIRSTCNTTC